VVSAGEIRPSFVFVDAEILPNFFPLRTGKRVLSMAHRPLGKLLPVLVFLFVGIETKGHTIEELDAALTSPTPAKAAAQ
jgi:hypothetical protein